MTGPQFDPQPGDTCTSGGMTWTVTARNGDMLTYTFQGTDPGAPVFNGDNDTSVEGWSDDFDGYYTYARPTP